MLGVFDGFDRIISLVGSCLPFTDGAKIMVEAVAEELYSSNSQHITLYFVNYNYLCYPKVSTSYSMEINVLTNRHFS